MHFWLVNQRSHLCCLVNSWGPSNYIHKPTESFLPAGVLEAHALASTGHIIEHEWPLRRNYYSKLNSHLRGLCVTPIYTETPLWPYCISYSSHKLNSILFTPNRLSSLCRQLARHRNPTLIHASFSPNHGSKTLALGLWGVPRWDLPRRELRSSLVWEQGFSNRAS